MLVSHISPTITVVDLHPSLTPLSLSLFKINISPKGTYDSLLHIHNPNRVSYIDLTGSGCETIAHVYDNGRITLMCNSFAAAPRILRLFGTAKVTEREDEGFPKLLAEVVEGSQGRTLKEAGTAGQDDKEKSANGAAPVSAKDMKIMGRTFEEMTTAVRSIITIDVFTCQTSCGYGVPTIADPESALQSSATGFNHRDTILRFGINKAAHIKPDPHSPSPLEEYWRDNNSRSLDGLPGTRKARQVGGEWIPLSNLLAAVSRWKEGLIGVVIGVMVTLALFILKDNVENLHLFDHRW